MRLVDCHHLLWPLYLSLLAWLTAATVTSVASRARQHLYYSEQDNHPLELQPTPTEAGNEWKTISIGLILSPSATESHHLERLILSHLDKLSTDASSSLSRGKFKVDLVTSELVENPIEMSKIVCQHMMANPKGGRVSAVIVDTDPLYKNSIASISYTLALYNIPIIGTTLREASLFNKNLHSSYISLTPPISHQADVWFQLMRKLGFERAIVLISMENHDLLSRFVNLVDMNRQQQQISSSSTAGDWPLKIEAIIEHDSESSNWHPNNNNHHNNSAWLHLVGRLESLLESSICRVFLVHAQSEEDVRLFMRLLDHLKLTTTPDTAILLTEETAQAATNGGIPLPVGALWPRLKSGDRGGEHAREQMALDALDIVLRAVEEMGEKLVSEQVNNLPSSCQMRPSDLYYGSDDAGSDLYSAIRRQQFAGLTGYISFDERGDRLTANYELLNSQPNGGTGWQPVVVGEFWNGRQGVEVVAAELDAVKAKIELNTSSIIWPGDVRGHLISGVHINRHLKIVTIEEKPFVWVLNQDESGGCEHSKIGDHEQGEALIPCRRRRNRTVDGDVAVEDDDERLCCKGYCMDLLREVSRRLNFTYDLYLAPDSQYGNLRSRREQEGGGSEKLEWAGLMGELVSGKADMAFAPLTITLARAQAIDFSKPFKFHGFAILLRRAPRHATLASFLQPFHNLLWILVIGVATHVVALALYLLDRYSTLGQFGIKRGLIPRPRRGSDHGDNNAPLHLSGSLWFSWSILLNSGIGEHTPKSLSGRVLGIFWSGFAMIVVASYTANLAAFLVLDSRDAETGPGQSSLSGIDDPRLRSGDLTLNLATVRGSAAEAYLQSQVEYMNLYRKMEEFDLASVEESLRALRAGSIDALIWDSTRLEWEVATDQDCSLGIAGELFGSGGYAIGLQHGSHWSPNVTTQLLELHEAGFMLELDKKWIAAGRGSVEQPNQTPSQCLIQRSEQDNKPETLGIFNIAGVFILFALGLVASLGLILVERLCHGVVHKPSSSSPQ